ncbi:hypothetical protein RhiirC2_854873 [Rhizophagus irregularis]|uniref:Uncharacterized protein n=1 Tax=Rhizophagus irregularis TaxID=588596 RepID=A0A2N1MPT7_9GLOM|nr:hypothetical protein RhiirC2_854873 [Rhizophagus irregularis]
MKELNLDEKFNDDVADALIDSLLVNSNRQYIEVVCHNERLGGNDEANKISLGYVRIKRSGKINPPIVIRPGDIIFGNLNGVVCIPRRLLDKVVENCKPVNTKIDARLKEK